MPSRSVPKALVVALIAVLTAAACGSTAQEPQRQAPIADVDVATTEPGGEPEPFLTDERTESRATGTRSQSQSQGNAAEEFVAAASSPPNQPGATTPAKDAPTGPGVTDRWITVGDSIALDESEILGDLNLPAGMTAKEYARALDILAEAINSTGGIAGRRLRWRIWRFNHADYSTFAEKDRAGCTFFTEENEVLVLRGQGGLNAGATTCIERNDGVSLIGALADLDVEMYRRYPHAFTPTGISLDRQAALLIDGLHAQGFLRPSDRIGLASWGGLPRYDRVIENVLKPMLAARGLELAAEARVRYPDGLYDLPRAEADGRTEVIRFKAENIDKVIFLSDDEFSGLLVAYAQEKNYYPRYGFTSPNGGAFGKPRATEPGPEPLEGSVAVGWWPTQDLGLSRGLRRSPSAASRCRALMEAGGLDVYQPGRLWAAQVANTMCDHVLFIKAAIEAGGPAITADSFMAGAEGLAAIDQAQVFATALSPVRHDGVAAYRYLRWFKACACFRYTSPLYKAE